jgi:MFS family permease
MKKDMRWYDYLTINSYWLGLNMASGIITPILLPYLVLLFMPPEQKNTYFATIRVVSLAVAMLVQPLAGMLSDRSTSRYGRRRPYIVVGAAFNVLFLIIVAISPSFIGAASDSFFGQAFGVTTAYVVLLAGIVVLQVSSNVAHGALQGLIPDLVPEHQRGRASGVKAVFELIPVFLVLFIGPLVDAGKVGLVVGIVCAGFVLTTLTTVLFVREESLREKPSGGIGEAALRLVLLTAFFVTVTRFATWLVTASSDIVTARNVALEVQIAFVGFIGLVAMAGAILVGVYLGAWVGIGAEARQQKSFIWWIVNRLLFLAAVGSVQSFAQYYLADVLHVPKPASATTMLMAAVAGFLIPSALGGGYLADRIGRKRLVMLSGLVAAGGTVVLLFASTMPVVIVGGCIIGLGAGTFMATNWALGTDLAPKQDAGRYLGISNLAGAGAGIVGAGLGGPMADFFNALRPGLGYLVIFALYAALFVLSSLTLSRVKLPNGE